MNRIFYVFFVVLLGCSQESGVAPAASSTFVRYFNGSYSDEAQALIETSDKGLVILANTTVDGRNKINLIKTDEFGNLLWQKFYPQADSANRSYNGYAITLTPSGGYVIVGERIQGTDVRLLIVTTDADGNSPDMVIKKKLSARRGISVAINPAGNVLALSRNPSESSVDLVLTEFKGNNMDSLWTRRYGAGELAGNLPNKLFTDAQGMAYWGGTVKRNSTNPSMRFIKTPPNSPNVLFDLTLGKPTDTEKANDMIRYGNTFVFAGTKGVNDSITVRRVTESGNQIYSSSYKITEGNEPLTGEISGNSACVAQDGGLVILGTIGMGAPGTASTNTNYCLIKIDGFGSAKPVWTKILGGRFNDRGKAIITASDGGHVVLGTTTLANVNTLLLMKVDKDGNIPGL